MSEKIRITQVKSVISQPQKMREIIQSLGLKRIGHTVEQKDNNCIRGMVNKVHHLIRYELI